MKEQSLLSGHWLRDSSLFLETSDLVCIHFSLNSADDRGFGVVELLFIEMLVALMPAVTTGVLGPLDEGLGNVF